MADVKILDNGEIKSVFENNIRKDFKKEEMKPLEIMIRLKEENHYRCMGFL